MTLQRRKKSDLPLSKLKALFDYNADTGVFTMLVSGGRKAKGSEAGYVNNIGYRLIWIDGAYYLAHRLAWYYVTGEWPEGEIDHKNRIPSDNRFANLHPCSRSQNEANSVRNTNTSGYRGVWLVNGRWKAAIKKDGKRTYLGTFSTPEEASENYQAAAARLFGDFAFKPAHQLSILDVDAA